MDGIMRDPERCRPEYDSFSYFFAKRQNTRALAKYVKVCVVDSDVRDFDKGLQLRMEDIILRARMRIDGFSITGAVDGLLETEKAIKKITSENSEAISQNPDIKELPDLYSRISGKIREAYLKQKILLKNKQILNRILSEGSSSLEAWYIKLEEVTDKLSWDLVGIRSEISETLQVFIAVREKLDKELGNVPILRKLSNITYGGALASLITVSMVVASIEAPLVAAALAAGFTIGSPGSWLYSFLKKYEIIMGQRDVMDSLYKATSGLLKDLDNIIILLQGPENSISSNQEDAGHVVIDIGEEQRFTNEMGILSEHTGSCSRDIPYAQDHQGMPKEVPLVDGVA